MTSHIPPEKLLPQDLVDLFDYGPADDPHDPPVVMRMHATDAKHAMDVEPERYSLDGPEPKPAAPEPDDHPAEIQTGASGPAWYPDAGDNKETE